MPDDALSDLTIVECGEGIPAAFAAKAFADLGAAVIKVEPLQGDRARRAGPFPGDEPHPERSGQFLYLNANKEGIALDLDQARGREIVNDLLRRADILITDLPPARLDQLGLGYPQLAPSHPRLIVTAISPFGQTGPYRDHRGTDLIAWQMGGTGYGTPFNGVTDPARQPPLRGGGHQAEYVAGWTAASATIVAVFYRLTYGIGQLVDVSMLEAVANNMRPQIAMHSYLRDSVPGSRLKTGAPWIYPCKDGYISTSVLRDHWWAALQDLPGRPSWVEDEALATGVARRQNAELIDAVLIEWFAGYTRAELYRELQSRGIPGFPVNSVGEVVHAPQYVARGFFVDQEHPLAGRVTQPGPMFRLSETPWRLRRPAPLLGEDNAAVLCDRLGYSRPELAALQRAGIISGAGVPEEPKDEERA